MVRPTKLRRVEFFPLLQIFGPYDIPDGNKPEEIIMQIEELESIRLKDLEDLDNELCADRMEVSRQTFQRILHTARAKIADCLVNGKTIRIQGGNYTRNICTVECLECGKSWKVSYENYQKILNGEFSCCSCNSKRIACHKNERKKFCNRNCWRHRGVKHINEQCFD